MLCVLIFYCVRKNEEDPLVAKEVNDALNKARKNFTDIFYKDPTIKRSTQPEALGQREREAVQGVWPSPRIVLGRPTPLKKMKTPLETCYRLVRD